MLVIRFLRIGKKNQPFFRIVATEKKNPPRGGRFLEILGFFNPQTKEKQIKKERVQYWISKGAQASPRAHNLFVTEGIIKEKKIAMHSKSKTQEPEPAPAATATTPVPAAPAPVAEPATK